MDQDKIESIIKSNQFPQNKLHNWLPHVFGDVGKDIQAAAAASMHWAEKKWNTPTFEIKSVNDL